MARRDDATIVFLGPSLPAAEARALLPGAALAAPVAVMDVVRLLRRRRPARLAIVDGYFERMAAVWHKELLLALELGVEVWGAASMGALRAAELDGFGVRGVGAIYQAYRRGRITSDAEVAVAHLPAEGGYLALSVPLVNVRAQVARARAARVLDPAAARAVIAHAATIAYWDRGWDAVDAALAQPTRARFATWRAAHPFDQKAEDARALLRARATAPPRPPTVLPVPRTWAFTELLRQAAARRARSS
jgi:hypothetical protein